MVTLAAKAALLLAINVAMGLAYTMGLDARRDYEPWETGSALYQIPSRTHCPYVFMGSSHMGALRRCPENVDTVREATGTDVRFIAKFGSGIFQHRLFLQEFYRRGNSADTIVCFIDPFAFYSPVWNDTMRFIQNEPLDLTFFLDLCRSRVSANTLFSYVHSKFELKWFRQRPNAINREICDKHVERRMPFTGRFVDEFYPHGTDEAMLRRYMEDLRKFIDIAESRGSQLILIEPPMLLGHLPGIEAFRRALRDTLDGRHVVYRDFSENITDIRLFRNHNHLNDAGVQVFMSDFLSPLLKESLPRNGDPGVPVPKRQVAPELPNSV